MLNRSLSEGFGQLGSLVDLNLSHCYELKELCEGIPPRILPLPAALAILASMDRGISSSVVLNRSLSEGFGQLKSLVELNLEDCYNLRELPAGIPAEILPLTPLLFGHELCLNRPGHVH